MNQKLISITSSTLVISLILAACDISITINPTAEPVSANPTLTAPTKVPEISNPTNPVATEVVPTANNLSSHDLYAGFTNSDQVPFVVLHQNGEQLAVTQDSYSGTKTGIVWSSPTEDSIFIKADEKGRPTHAVLGEDVVRYSNYTDSTVDITVIDSNGSIQYFRVEYNSDFVRKIEARQNSLYFFAAYNTNNNFGPYQQDFWDYLDYGFIALGAVSCAGLFLTANPTLLALASTCGGLILDVVVKAAEITGVDIELVGALDAESTLVDSLACATSAFNFGGCVEVVANVAEITYREGSEIISNLRLPTTAPEPKTCTGKYCP